MRDVPPTRIIAGNGAHESSMTHSPLVWVGLGGWLALTAVGGIAVLVGSKIRDRFRPELVQRAAGFLFAAFALVALWQAVLA